MNRGKLYTLILITRISIGSVTHYNTHVDASHMPLGCSIYTTLILFYLTLFNVGYSRLER